MKLNLADDLQQRSLSKQYLKISVPNQRKLSSTKIDWLMLLKEIIVNFSNSHINPINGHPD
jgi:hypothetical protein